MQANIPFQFQINNTTTKEVFRPIHYLGSKLRILDFIEETINNLDPNKGKVCDLFSGSGSVSFKLSKTRPVVSVDIQEYSSIICSTLLNPIKIEQNFIDDFILKCINSEHAQKLNSVISPLINYENECVENALKKAELEPLCNILEKGSIIGFEKGKKYRDKTYLSKLINDTIILLKAKNLLDKQSLAIRYFGGVYFSYKQALHIDLILEEIENSPLKYRNQLVASLLSTASECVNTVGKQFAQPIRPRKSNGDIKPSIGQMVVKDRGLNIFEVFIKWVKKYNSISSNFFQNKVLKKDFSDALNTLANDVSVVYADPPYTRDHYSRFYHVLETIALRDTPEISTMVLEGETLLSRGLYRENRHQSPFCIRSQAPDAFEEMFSKISAIGAKFVLSYSPYDESKNTHPRVVSMGQLIEMAKKYYSSIEVISPGSFIHSKLNSTEKHLEASEYAEVLIVCS